MKYLLDQETECQSDKKLYEIIYESLDLSIGAYLRLKGFSA